MRVGWVGVPWPKCQLLAYALARRTALLHGTRPAVAGGGGCFGGRGPRRRAAFACRSSLRDAGHAAPRCVALGWWPLSAVFRGCQGVAPGTPSPRARGALVRGRACCCVRGACCARSPSCSCGCARVQHRKHLNGLLMMVVMQFGAATLGSQHGIICANESVTQPAPQVLMGGMGVSDASSLPAPSAVQGYALRRACPACTGCDLFLMCGIH